MRALIVEDEAIARSMLTKLLSDNFPDIVICGTTDSVGSTISYLDKHPEPDVIFMDVELGDGNCFDFFRMRKLDSLIVMTTAYDSYAIKAFETGSIDYLLKPISKEALKRAVDRCRERLESGIVVGAGKKYLERCTVKIGEQYIPIASSEMACFISEDKSNYLIKKDGKRFVIDSTMDNLEKDLNPDDFFRICRGAIVSRSSILSSTRQMGGRLKLNLIPECPTDLYVSRGRAESFLKWLG